MSAPIIAFVLVLLCGVQSSYSEDLPGKVLNIHTVRQDENTYLIGWEPPAEKNVPITFYDFEAHNLINKTKKKSLKIEGNLLTANVTAPLDEIVGVFVVTISAVNVDSGTGKELRGPEANETFKYDLPRKPKDVTVNELKSDSISFTITPPRKSWIYFYKVDVDNVFNNYTLAVTSVTGLKPYDFALIGIKTCFRQEPEEILCSQELFSTSIRTNVAAPGKVGSLRDDILEDDKPTISWFSPAVRNGPIDGYLITAFDLEKENSPVFNDTIGGNEKSFKLEKGDIYKSYKFIVSAFNKDLETGESILGEKAEVLYKARFSSTTLIIILSVAAGLVVLGAIGGFLYSRRKAF